MKYGTCQRYQFWNYKKHLLFGNDYWSKTGLERHIARLSGEISRSYCYALRVMVNEVGMKAALSVYHSHILSRVRYGIIFWGNSVEAGRVQIMQKRCIRTIFIMKPRDSCKPVFKEKRLMTVTNLYIFESLKFMIQNKKLFDSNIRAHTYNTRLKTDQKPNFTKYTFIQRNVYYSILKIWNHVPNIIRLEPEKCFLRRMRLFLTENPFYCVGEYFGTPVS